jgi:hypothetical protein
VAEAISPPVERFHEPRTLSGVAKRRTQTLNRSVHAVLEIHKRAVGPQPIANLLTRDHIACALEQHAENVKRLVLQPHTDATLAQFTRTKIHLELVESRHLACHCSFLPFPPILPSRRPSIAQDASRKQPNLMMACSGHQRFTFRSPERH